MLGPAIDWLLRAKDGLSNAFLTIPVTFFVTVGLLFCIVFIMFVFKKKD